MNRQISSCSRFCSILTLEDIKLLSKLPGKKKRGRPKKPEGAPISHHKKPKKTKKEVAAEKAAKEAAAAAAASASGGPNSEGAARESVDSQDSGNSNSQQQYPQPTQNHQVGVHSFSLIRASQNLLN